ncbi:hypothetical protein, partial [Myxococcus sp. CA039A]|uniref:hypothetical protein n=1 Tax=Myxococcus sp. CA039A TaxID=2741737 RepID=UPI0020C5E386
MPADEVSTSSTKGEPVAGRSSQATEVTSTDGDAGAFRETARRGDGDVEVLPPLEGTDVVVFAALVRAVPFFAALFRVAPVFAVLLRAAPFFAALFRVALFFAGAFRVALLRVAAFFGVEARRDDFFAALVLRFFVAMGDSSWAARIVALSRCGSAAPCVQVSP